ncbi:MAG: hypothetical protein ACJ72D_09430 [Marmoricola sp.]
MNASFALQRTVAAANAYDEDPSLLTLVEPDLDGLRTAALHDAHEVGTWSLEYLGPGFHVQLRIARRNRQARLDGWMSPAQPITVLLTSLLHRPVLLETRVSDSGRFEFPVAPTGACRMSFVLPTAGRPPATPPFWV